MNRSNSESLEGRTSQLDTDDITQKKVARVETVVLTTPENKSLPPTTPKPKNHKHVILVVLGAIAVVVSVFGYRWWQYISTHEQTDNAYVTANIHPISTRINGTVSEVSVNDNQLVQKDQLLVKLDPGDYQIQVQQAQASLTTDQRQANAALSNINLSSGNVLGNTQQAQGNVASARAAISTAIASAKAAQAAVPAAQASVAQAQANLEKAQADYNRYKTLYVQGVVPRQQLDTYRATYYVDLAQKNSALQGVLQAQANQAQARESVTKAQAQLAASQGGLQQAKATGEQTKVNQAQYKAALAQIAQSQANLDNAKLQLSYTNIVALSAGRVGNKVVQVGQRVQPGSKLMAIVEDNPWVVANFKETQVAHMRIGQKVEILIDAIPKHHFIGYVNSFSPGSGATFALLPSDNATGNFTKIVQRVPVKIVFDTNSIRGYESRIVPGLSVETTVNVKE
ncbi:HlyD family secretion protein [Nostoc sp.]|uniref:HlyD family secretion protein n=1 Tax=Nostoc sp. TaxID=1180 RepID=UPI002FF88340